MIVSLIAAAIGGCFTIVGVLVGSLLSQRSSQKQDTRRLLSEFYSEVFVSYSSCIPNWETKDVVMLIAAIEKTKLVCSKKSSEILDSLALAATEHPVSNEKCGLSIQQLRASAKNDIGK